MHHDLVTTIAGNTTSKQIYLHKNTKTIHINEGNNNMKR